MENCENCERLQEELDTLRQELLAFNNSYGEYLKGLGQGMQEFGRGMQGIAPHLAEIEQAADMLDSLSDPPLPPGFGYDQEQGERADDGA